MNLESLKAIATSIRTLSIDAIEKSNSGHPGLPLGAADFATVLWTKYLKFNPKNPKWHGRDRFVLSAGHGSMLQYSLLHLFGFDLPMSQLENFRQWDSKTPGHPEFGVTDGVETTTGPLGAGFSNGVGMALGAKMLKARLGDELFEYRVFGVVSDGDLMEGVASEAASLAGHLKLNNLIYLYDDNLISLAGHTDVCFTESVPDRFKAYGWNVLSCNGHDFKEIEKCLDNAVIQKDKPTIICCRTTLGFGSPNKANTHDAHGAPLGAAEVKLVKEALGAPSDKNFYVLPEAKTAIDEIVSGKIAECKKWEENYSAWSKANPEKLKLFEEITNRTLPSSLKQELFDAFKEPKKDATRNLSQKALNIISAKVPSFIGGSADLEPSTKTTIKDAKDVQAPDYSGKNIRYGVREHAMGGAANGLAYTQSWIPYTATFHVFSDYMRPTIRLAALSHLQTLFIFTHDSFWVGEDGPTHEPIEQTQSLRLIPNLYVFRPADGVEVAGCYWDALNKKNRPSCLLFSRQNLPALERPASFTNDDISKGAYIVYEGKKTDLVIVATGSEVAASVEAAKAIEAEGKYGVRVVSMPCVELFMEQALEYREKLIPKSAKRVSVEAGTTIGWERIVGSDALLIGINHFGASAPGELLADKFGFTAAGIQKKISSWI
jgi:transketolase